MLGYRSGQTPEKLLGSYFGATGLAYIGWQLPVILKVELSGGPMDLAA